MSEIDSEPEFEIGDNISIEGKIGQVIKINEFGEDKYNVEVFFDNESRKESFLYPIDDIRKLPTFKERIERNELSTAIEHRLFLDSLRFKYAHSDDPVHSLGLSRIDPVPHQIEAVYEIINSYKPPRYLIADDAGLGKTIITGMIYKELKARERAERALFVLPAPLKKQWAREMREKFDERFTIYDSSYINSLTLAPTDNPWDDKDKIVTSVDYAKQEGVKENISDSEFDLIVFDEAHKLSRYKSGGKVETTNRYTLGEDLSDKTDGLLLLTATPHKGDRYAFYSLFELLDPDYFPSVDYLNEEKVDDFMIRRTKEEVTDFDGEPLFPEREVETLPVDYSEEEWELYNGLKKYVTDYYNKALKENRRHSVGFAMVILQKRMVSSIYSIQKSLKNRKRKLEDLHKRGKIFEEPDKEQQVKLEKYQKEPDMMEDEEKEEIERLLETISVANSLDELRKEIDILGQLVDKAKSISKDTKAQELNSFVRGTLKKDPEEKILVFTEYTDTLDYLKDEIFEDLNPAIIHGGMGMDAREREEEKFRSEDCHLMIATDAAGEGLNLQFCHMMVNYELPWNPMKIEQRMGRLHRYGQEHIVKIYNMMINETRESEIFQTLLSKLDTIKEDMGDRVFDVTGELLSDINISELVMEAISSKNKGTTEDLQKRISKDIEEKKEKVLKEIEEESLIKDRLNLEEMEEIALESKEKGIEPREIARFLYTFLEHNDYGEIKPTTRDKIFTVDIKPSLSKAVNDALNSKRITFDLDVAQDHNAVEFINLRHDFMENIFKILISNTTDGNLAILESPFEKPGFIFTFRTTLADGKGDIHSRFLDSIFISIEGETEFVSPKAVWDLSPVEKLSNKDALNQLSSCFDSLKKRTEEEILTEVDRKTEDVIEEQNRYIEIKRRDSESYWENRIEHAKEELKEAKVKAEENADYEIQVRKWKSKLENFKEEYQIVMKKIEKESKIRKRAPELLSCTLCVPDNLIEEPVFDEEGKLEVEKSAMDIAMRFEKSGGRNPSDVSKLFRGYDIKSEGGDEVRFIEVKGINEEKPVEITSNEWSKAESLGEDYWLYIVVRPRKEDYDLHKFQNPAENFDKSQLDFKKIELDWR